jgi:hypothetical protein
MQTGSGMVYGLHRFPSRVPIWPPEFAAIIVHQCTVKTAEVNARLC